MPLTDIGADLAELQAHLDHCVETLAAELVVTAPTDVNARNYAEHVRTLTDALAVLAANRADLAYLDQRLTETRAKINEVLAYLSAVRTAGHPAWPAVPPPLGA